MRINNRVKLILIIPLILLISGAIFYASGRGEIPQPGYALRLPAQNEILRLEKLQIAALIENIGDGERVWGLRGEAKNSTLNPALVLAAQMVEDAPFLANRAFDPNIPPIEEARPHILAPLLFQDGATQPRLYAAQPEGFEDALDSDGHPIRWRLPENLLAGYSLFRRSKAEDEADPSPLPMPRLKLSGKASDYRAIVENFARRFNLSVDLVMAIIHSESDFSPTLVSSKSAMGLMQLLPSTASDEVHRFLYGRRGQVSFEELRVPETNIHYGTAYLHILLNRYFPNVKDREVREACAIAAYNMGPNRFLRLYGSNQDLAAEKINSMSAEEFYNDLASRLPVRETRYFVNKVRQMKQRYSSLP